MAASGRQRGKAAWRGLALAAVLAVAAPALAQEAPATLVADRLELGTGNVIVAVGNVEVIFDGQRLRASRVEYDRTTGTLKIEGPITLVARDGTVITATAAELSDDLKSGIIESARIVLDDQMQIAAVEGQRAEGRYNQLYKVTASSCRVCDDGPPLWQVRARRMVHDEEAKQLYFYDAFFDIGGVPVMYLPRLRLPDPTLTRSTGFLVPRYTQSTILGHGVKVPYFVVINDHSDLTFTPYLAEKTLTLETRYRQAFRTGTIEVNGALSSDDVLPGQLRWYIDAEGSFDLPYDFNFSFGAEVASDSTYASEYGYSGSDYLTTFATIDRTRRLEYIGLSATTYLPLATTATTESFVGSLTYDRRFTPDPLVGEIRLGFDLEAPGPGVGQDEFHGHAELGWRRDFTLGAGVLAAVEGQVAADYYRMRPTSGLASEITNVVPGVAAELRWPLSRDTAAGGTDVLEPVFQLAWSGTPGTAVPNEDGLLVEFDEGNLLDLSRFPGDDAVEQGFHAALGLGWTRFDPRGWELRLSAARVIRADDLGQFTQVSGLDGFSSDWLVSGGADFGWFDVATRTLFDDSLSVTKAATRLAMSRGGLSLAAGHSWQLADAVEGRATNLSEVVVEAGYSFTRHWRGSFDYRYDLTAGQASETGVGLYYDNECLSMGLTWAQRNVISTTTTSDTEIGLSVSLNGVGNDGRPYRRACRI